MSGFDSVPPKGGGLALLTNRDPSARPGLTAVSRVLLLLPILLLFVLLACAVCPAQTPVLLISIDGLRPDYILEADAHGLRVPNLRRLAAEGAYATGVK